MVLTTELYNIYIQGLEALDNETYPSARELLSQVWEKAGPDPVRGSDLALSMFGCADDQAALSLYAELSDRYPKDSFVFINSYYCRAASEQKRLPAPKPEAKVRRIKRSSSPLKPKISVIICTYNRPKMIRESISSILNQTFKDFELLVVNDGGDRAVAETLASFEDPRIVFVDAAHGGLSSARNVGMACARGEYAAFLDDDDIWYPGHLELLYNFFVSHPEARVVYSDLYRAYQKNVAGNLEVVKRVLDYSHDFSRRRAREQSLMPINSTMFRLSCVDQVGLFKEDLQCTMDWDYYLRLSEKYKLHHLVEITGEFRTRQDGSQMTAPSKYARDYFRNLILFGNRLFPLTGMRLRAGRQGRGKVLRRELDRLMDFDDKLVRELELRKLFSEPYYALFYQLGKLLRLAGRFEESRMAFASARRLAPFEPKTYFAEIKAIADMTFMKKG